MTWAEDVVMEACPVLIPQRPPLPVDAEFQKGVDSIKARTVYSADEVDAALAK